METGYKITGFDYNMWTQAGVSASDLDLVAGDDVRIEFRPGDDEWTVTERLPRRNVLCRSDSRGRRESLAANLDQIGIEVTWLAVFSAIIVGSLLGGLTLAASQITGCPSSAEMPGSDMSAWPARAC